MILEDGTKGQGEDTTMTQTERTELARRMNSYTVYDNKTGKIVACGTFTEVEDYVENPGRYTVVHDYSGYRVEE
jgi:hypothetical protein